MYPRAHRGPDREAVGEPDRRAVGGPHRGAVRGLDRGAVPGPVRGAALVAVLAALVAAHVLGAAPVAADQTFGGDPLERVLDRAAVYGDDCASASGRLSAERLAALVIAPTFPETGAPTTQAPSPMTLSRYDTQSNLYSYGNPSTYVRAFWTPGVGAWQWDDASLYGFAAHQRIDQAFIIDHTTRLIAQRWCAGRRLDSVWSLWNACGADRCLAIYNDIYQGGELVNITADDLVGRFGGMQRRTCAFGQGAPFTCWFVDPARAQGYAGFAQPGFGPAPVPSPFYTFRVGDYEERHFLAAHSGYDRSIRGRLLSGLNSRTNGALQWTTGSGLCDVTVGIGDCFGFVVRNEQVRGSYQPLAGDFNGDGLSDVLWYGAGSRHDGLWFGRPRGFATTAVSIKGVYDPAVGDFDGDGFDDIIWYGPGSATDSIWWGRSSGWQIQRRQINVDATPIVGDFNGNGRDQVLFYAPGSKPDVLWSWSATRSVTTTTKTVNGTYDPIVANFDGSGGDDILWYGPGAARDSLWMNGAAGMPAAIRDVDVKGVYQPVAGDYDDDGRDDVLWYGPGSAKDSLWWSSGGGFRYESVRADAVAVAFAGDFDGLHGDDIFFHVAGLGLDPVWYSNP